MLSYSRYVFEVFQRQSALFAVRSPTVCLSQQGRQIYEPRQRSSKIKSHIHHHNISPHYRAADIVKTRKITPQPRSPFAIWSAELTSFCRGYSTYDGLFVGSQSFIKGVPAAMGRHTERRPERKSISFSTCCSHNLFTRHTPISMQIIKMTFQSALHAAP